MITDHVVSTFRGTLRQITPEALSSEGALVLRTCAPLFLPPSEADRVRALEQLLMNNRGALEAAKSIYVPTMRPRRYSGDILPGTDQHTLSVGNYFSVCDGADGQDYGTLVNELNAYRVPTTHFRTEFIDCLNPEVAARLRASPTPHILVIVAEARMFLDVLPPDALPSVRADVQLAASAGRPYLIKLGCRVVKADIEGVLDLRRTAAQDWFLEQYVNLATRPNRCSRFLECLPELFEPTLGGSSSSNLTLQIIGADLRRRGFNAFIYPSARSDVALERAHDGSIRSKGWNLVRYAGEAPAEFLHDDNGSEWTTEFWSGIAVSEFDGDDGSYGWQVVGVQELHDLYYTKGISIDQQHDVWAQIRLGPEEDPRRYV